MKAISGRAAAKPCNNGCPHYHLEAVAVYDNGVMAHFYDPAHLDIGQVNGALILLERHLGVTLRVLSPDEFEHSNRPEIQAQTAAERTEQ